MHDSFQAELKLLKKSHKLYQTLKKYKVAKEANDCTSSVVDSRCIQFVVDTYMNGKPSVYDLELLSVLNLC